MMEIKRSSGRCMWFSGLLAMALVLSACTRSPEAKSAKFIAEGKRLLLRRDPARAILQFRNAAQATPKDPQVYYELGLAFLAAGDITQGTKALRETLALNPEHNGARLVLAQLMAFTSEPDLLKDAQQK